eukprot:Clim_evm95s149 gene=Clim_evmTU95s149
MSTDSSKQIFRNLKVFVPDLENAASQGNDELLTCIKHMRAGGASRIHNMAALVAAKEDSATFVRCICLADHLEFQEVDSCWLAQIPVIQSSWVEDSMEIGKALPLNDYRVMPKGCFQRMSFGIHPQLVGNSDMAADTVQRLKAVLQLHQAGSVIIGDETEDDKEDEPWKKTDVVIAQKLAGQSLWEVIRKEEGPCRAIVTPEWISKVVLGTIKWNHRDAVTNGPGVLWIRTGTMTNTDAVASHIAVNGTLPQHSTQRVTEHNEALGLKAKDREDCSSDRAYIIENGLFGGHVAYIDPDDHQGNAPLRRLWRGMLESHGAVVMDEFASQSCDIFVTTFMDSTNAKDAKQASCLMITPSYLSDCVSTNTLLNQDMSPLYRPMPSRNGVPGATELYVTITGFEKQTREDVKDMLRIMNVRYTGVLTKNHTHLVALRPTGAKYEKAKQWGIKVVSSDWVKTALDTWSIPDETEYGLTPRPTVVVEPPPVAANIDKGTGDISPYRQRTDPTPHDLFAPQPLTAIPPTKSTAASKSPERYPNAALRKRLTKKQPHLIFTAMTKKEVQPLLKLAREDLECQVVADVSQATHLVAKEIIRTSKFLVAVSRGLTIVHPNWILRSGRDKSLLDEEPFLLHDPEKEQQFKFNLSEAVAKARCGHRVFGGLQFFVCPNTGPSAEELKPVIEAGGGTLIENVKTLPINLRECTNITNHQPSVVIIGSEEDWEWIQKHLGSAAVIFDVEFLLRSGLVQRCDFHSDHLDPPRSMKKRRVD